jgi:hypothetical protein
MNNTHTSIEHLIITLRRHMAGCPVLPQETREVA